jgi:hypothetical protein
VRNPDWSFGIALSRGLLARSTALAGAAVYLLVIAGLGYFVRAFGGNWGNALATLLIFGAGLLLALVALSETFRSKVRVLVAKNFLAYRYDYREEWLKFTRTLSEREPNQSLADACVRALASLVESSGRRPLAARRRWRLPAALSAQFVRGRSADDTEARWWRF